MSSTAAAADNRRRRRVIPIIDARFQWKYTLLITALGVGVTAIMGGLLYNAHRDNTSLLKLDPSLTEQVLRGDQIFLLYLILTVIVMAVVLSLWGLIVTHRISGPLYIVARYLDVLADGQYPDMRPLRKRDELQDFFATFEEAVNGLRNRDVAMLASLNAALSKAKSGDASAAVQALERYQADLTRAVGADGEGVVVDHR